jgi:hypothetical protein
MWGEKYKLWSLSIFIIFLPVVKNFIKISVKLLIFVLTISNFETIQICSYYMTSYSEILHEDESHNKEILFKSVP